MYETYFHLSADPFGLNPDPFFCYEHPGYRKAKSYMSYALQRGEGFLLITGKPGTGKTTLTKDLINDLDPLKFKFTTLVSTQLDADDLLRSIAYSYELPIAQADKATVIEQLTRYLQGRYRQHQHTLLIVDEAQDLTPRAMEELRLLTNLEWDSHPLLQVFLIGQPQLYELLGSNSLEQLRQRITVATAILPLAFEELENYVQHRLALANWRHDPAISKDVYPLLFASSEGIPRRINLICSRLFLYAFASDKHQISLEDMHTALEELGTEQLSDTHSLLKTKNLHEKHYISLVPQKSKKDAH